MPFITKTSVFFSAILVTLLVVFCVVLAQWADGIRDATSSDSGHNLQGSISGVDLNNYSNSKQSMAVCLVSMVEVEKNETEDAHGYGFDEDEEMLICNRVSGKYDSGVSDNFLYIKNVPKQTINANQKALLNNEWFVTYSHDWVKRRQNHVSTIHVPKDHTLRTIDPSQVPHHHSISPPHRRELTLKLDERRRRLNDILGIRTVVVVAVSYFDPLDVLYDHVFGVNNSLISQMDDCSQSQVTIAPHPVYPIIEVFPPQDPSQYTFVELYAAVLDSIKIQLGLTNGESITSTTDHLLLIVPDTIDRRPGELGWGATPGYFSGIIHSLAPSTMTILHELGHNFGLGHAYEDHVAYSDMTTVMGYSHRNVVKMCYNGQNMFSMGWFRDRRTSVELSNNRNDKEIINLAFYGDYTKTTNNQPVIVRYGDIFLTYNRQRGINIETKEYANMLLVVKELPGQYHSHTNLEAALDVESDPLEIRFSDNNNDKIFIAVCSHVAGNTLSPDMLTVAIGRNKNNLCPGTSRQQSNRGVQASEQKPLDCRTTWPWVEIVDLASPIGKNYVLCELVAKDPNRYCDETNERDEDKVWKTCRLECPQSGCIEQQEPAAAALSAASTTRDGDSSDSDCQDLFSWVELDMGNGNYMSKTCEELGAGFLQDREYFCNKYDTVTHLPVYEVCRINCPGSGCSN